jgi:hypothetical protein
MGEKRRAKEMKNSYKILLKDLKRTDHSEELHMHGRIILK